MVFTILIEAIPFKFVTYESLPSFLISGVVILKRGEKYKYFEGSWFIVLNGFLKILYGYRICQEKEYLFHTSCAFPHEKSTLLLLNARSSFT